ncbi:MAG: hypothetical protein KBF66_17750 [Rhodoferax sp.]|uniref:hypothetical protein n=1 Tax=Rhodoferax sp. TaxID=50421 RepID=UPI001B6BFCA1|nr:hypothetical protein [Rhodoferax sp.]MBP9907394.1 hypothetical protein [Rhodoferax sp.]
MSYIALLLASVATFYLLGYFAKRFPMLGILGGIGLCVAPIVFWINTRAINFRSEGSIGGLVLIVFFGFICLISVGLGLYLIGIGSRASRGEEVDVAAEVRNNMAPLFTKKTRK